jgi:hypothetical protein
MWHNLGSRSATISDYVSSLETASSREDFKNAVKGIKACSAFAVVVPLDHQLRPPSALPFTCQS